METFTTMMDEQPLIIASLAMSVLPLLLVVLILFARAIQALVVRVRARRAQRAKADEVDNLLLEVDAAPQEPPVPVISPISSEPNLLEPDEDEQEDVLSSAMQELLTSVFDDEEHHKRSEAILSDLRHIDISDLAAACANVARRLKARSA